MEAPPGIGPGMKVLQTSALPLGYGAMRWKMRGERGEGKNRNREGNKSEKSGCECMRFASAILERITGLEPATSTLARSRSTK